MEKICRSAAAATNSSSSSSATATATATATTSDPAANSSSGENTNTNTLFSSRSTPSNTPNYISSSFRVLNKSSYKISKPISKPPNHPTPNLLRPPPLPQSSSITTAPSPPQQQSQPPVYNIDKNDFRDVVQKLTGSPAHLSHRPPPPPPPPPPPQQQQPPRPSAVAPQPLSRLHRIRPPPLAQLPPIPAAPPVAGEVWVRPPLSPLPPFPTVSAAAESPISAYMRRLHSGQTQLLAPSPTGAAQMQLLPLSPLSFGCAPPAQTAAAYQVMLSPSLLFPTSPGMPIPSPK